MSLASRAARGALWTVASSMGGRAVGVLGTLLMTRFLAPHEIGEVAAATIVCMTASWLTIWGFGQYAVVKGRGADAAEVRWHATLAYAGLGVVSLGAVVLLGDRLVAALAAPAAARYVPGMALALLLRRLAAMPERILVQRMEFRPSGLALALGELAYTVTALALAAAGLGGMAIVHANIVQALVMLAILVRAAGVASWATPTPLSAARVRDMLRFGVPLGVQGVAHQASRYWDKLAISNYFGASAVGTYNMAYNLADIPAIQVGEQIALVLLPSMAELPPARRPAALERASALLSLIIFPLAIGLGLVAGPLIALLLPAGPWQQVAPLLTVLTCLSVFRPITWVLSAYLEAEGKTDRLMLLELGKVAALLLGIAALHPLGLRAAAVAVGLAFGATALAGCAVVAREGVSPARLLAGFVRPLAACAIMTVGVLATGRALAAAGITHPAIVLPLELAAGAASYVVAALGLARDAAADLLGLLRRAVGRA